MWEEDFKEGKKTEHELISLLIMRGAITGWKEPQGNFSYWDMQLETAKGEVTIEVKNDKKRQSTRCVGIEYECKGKPSGIAISKADYYVYKLGNDFWVVQRSRLINLLLASTSKRDCRGGDDGTAKLWAIPESEFYSVATKIGTDLLY